MNTITPLSNDLYVYFDATGAGSMPSVVAGPFPTQEAADQYMIAEGMTDPQLYFTDVLYDEE